MTAVIVAGGEGKRLAGITKNEIPKPMVKIAGVPLIERQINVLKQNGIFDIIIMTGFLGDKITGYFNDGNDFGVNIRYINEEQPLGSAGSLFYLKDTIKEDFLLVYGDVLFDISKAKMFEFHKSKKADATLFIHPNSHPYDSDIIIMNGENRITGFSPKNTKRETYKNLVNAGIYILNPSVLELIKQDTKTDLEKDVFFNNIDKLKLYGYVSTEYVKDAGTADRINAVTIDVQSGTVSLRNISNKQKCIFLDRDGTINKYVGLLSSSEQMELEQYAAHAISLINGSSYLCIVITNQPVIARNMCSLEGLSEIHNKMETLLGEHGAYVDGIYFCPHHPDKGFPEENTELKIQCGCRKPSIGMIEQCIEKYNIDLSESWFIGDTTIDIQTGKNAGLKTILLKTGLSGSDKKYEALPDMISENLADAVNFILKGYGEADGN